MKQSLLLTLIILFANISKGQPLSTYYSSLEGKYTEGLKTATHLVIKVHLRLSYTALWKYFQQTDCMPNDTLRIWDMYSNNTTYFSDYSTLNKEHCVPNSWWGGPDVDSEFAYRDLNNLYPANETVNMSKSNNPLSEVGATTLDNGVSKSGTSIFQGYTGKAFEPADEYKGDFARTYLYMATCYQDYTTWMSDTTGKYQIIIGTYPSLQKWAINLLLKWHRQDTVSQKEKIRNDKVFKLQQNRNPFIDYPLLAEYIWGNMKDSVWYSSTTDIKFNSISKPNIYPNPSKDQIYVNIENSISSDYQYVIYSITGLRKKSGNTTTIDISQLSKGVYSCVITNQSKQYIYKVIVQ